MNEAVKIIKDKSTLAKLLAGEDLNVVYNTVETASFDVKSRTLTLPKFKDMSEDVMDLLTLHEVGHALYTPLEMLEEVKNTKIPFGIVNILEDVRIEKMIQDKYLGAVRNFKKGYAELISKDFFKLDGRDLNSYSLIDKINLKSKHVDDVPMSEEDMVWYQKAQDCKSYEDVMALAESIHGYMEDQKPETDNHETPEFDDSDNDEVLDNTEKSTIPDSSDGESVEEENNEDTGGQNGDSEDDSEEDDSNTGDEDQTETNKPDEDIVEGSYGETDNQLGRSLSQSANLEGDFVNMVSIPKVKDSIVRSSELVMNDLTAHYEKQIRMEGDNTNCKKYLKWCANDFAEFRKSNKKTVAYMVKEFEMKKAADQYARSSVAKTGSLNMDVVHQYKFNDDLFNRVTSMPDAKSHGLVMYLDWSGSMYDNIHATVKQLITLTMFCDAVQIPYRVYAFSDGFNATEYDDKTYVQDPKIGDIAIDILDMLEFASSENNKKQQIALYEMLWTVTQYYNQYDVPYLAQLRLMDCYPVSPPNTYRLGGTPLNHALVAGMTLIPKFKKQYGLQKVQLVLLTDGASHDCNEYYSQTKTVSTGETVHWKDYYRTSQYRKQVAVIKDKESGYQIQINDDSYFQKTQNYMSLLKKKIPNLNIINFHLVATNKNGKVKRREVENQIDYMHRGAGEDDWRAKYDMTDKVMKDLKKNNSASIKSKSLNAIDAYFILPGGVALDTEQEDALDGVDNNATKAQLKKAFVKSTTGKKINRPLLNEFMSLVA